MAVVTNSHHNLLAWNSKPSLSHSSAGQKLEISVCRLKSRCQRATLPLSYHGKISPLLFQPLVLGEFLKKKKFFFFFANFFRLFLAVLSLHCCVGFCLVAAREDYSLVVVHGLHIAMAALVAGHRL